MLDRRVQFQRATYVDDGFGKVPVWSDHGGRIFAARQDVSDGERAAAGQIEATIVARFVVRSSPFTRALNPGDRLSHECKEWDIQGIKEARMGRRAFLEITARARADV